MMRPFAALFLLLGCLLAADAASAQQCRRTCRVDETRDDNGCCIAGRPARAAPQRQCRTTCRGNETRDTEGCCAALITGRDGQQCRRTCRVDETRDGNGCCLARATRRRTTTSPRQQAGPGQTRPQKTSRKAGSNVGQAATKRGTSSATPSRKGTRRTGSSAKSNRTTGNRKSTSSATSNRKGNNRKGKGPANGRRTILDSQSGGK